MDVLPSECVFEIYTIYVHHELGLIKNQATDPLESSVLTKRGPPVSYGSIHETGGAPIPEVGRHPK